MIHALEQSLLTQETIDRAKRAIEDRRNNVAACRLVVELLRRTEFSADPGLKPQPNAIGLPCYHHLTIFGP